jgi:hypothetical protein
MRPFLTDLKGYTKCCLAIFRQLYQKVTAQIPIQNTTSILYKIKRITYYPR